MYFKCATSFLIICLQGNCNRSGDGHVVEGNDDSLAMNTGTQGNDILSQMALSSVSCIANGGLGLLIIGGLVCFND